MGNPSVRFDEGREMFWSLACRPLNPASPAYSTTKLESSKPFFRFLAVFNATVGA
jgi:hypothetical protein